MKLALLTDEMREQMLLRARSAPECRAALEAMSGEVLELRILGHRTYRLAFRNGSIDLDPEAEPTIVTEAKPEVIDAILEGRLDPLHAMLLRRLKTTIDPRRGPLLRTILRASLGSTTGDMSWERALGKDPRSRRQT